MELTNALSTEEQSAVQQFLAGTFREGLKNFVLAVPLETLKLVLQFIPFSGPAQIAVTLILNIVNRKR